MSSRVREQKRKARRAARRARKNNERSDCSETVWFWCLHCRRTYPVKWEGTHSNLGSCPFPLCDGGVVDQVPWVCVQEQNPSFPEIPGHGVVYHPKPGGICLGDGEINFFVAWG